MEDKILLKVDHLKTFFKTKSGILPAVNGVSFTLKRGEVLGVVGQSGSYSTVRLIISGFPATKKRKSGWCFRITPNMCL